MIQITEKYTIYKYVSYEQKNKPLWLRKKNIDNTGAIKVDLLKDNLFQKKYAYGL